MAPAREAGLELIPSTILRIGKTQVAPPTGAAATGDAAVATAPTALGIAHAATELAAPTAPTELGLALARAEDASRRTASKGAALQPGERARYERVGLLGEGGMGQVEQVRDRDLLRDVAVKQLRPELLDDPQILAQFLWEARVTAYLDHPNIVAVHDLGLTPEGRLFFTMKLVRGSTLASVIGQARSKPTDPAGLTRRLRLFLQLCNAISFAHSRGVLHRDLKPANVMVGEYGEVLVTDWGLALPLPGPESAELSRIMPDGLQALSAGTPLYMSPEQVQGEPLDARSDVYTLGAMLYELIALRPSVQGTGTSDVLAKVVMGQHAPLQHVAPHATSSLTAVVEKAMALQPGQRYQDVRALSEDVETILDGRTPKAEDVSLVTRAARYYVARDPAMAQLRVVDFDSWAFGAMMLGVGLALLARHWVSPPNWSGWLFMLVGLTIAAPSTLRWLRLRRGAGRH